jgi:XTP/dITP diphosphohydrolase
MFIYACSTNRGKLEEFALAARESDLTELSIQPLPVLADVPPPEENGITFEENASLKALYYSRFTPQIVLADDSGIEIDALSGAPGVHSARYAGPGATDAANNALLLSNLVNAENRAGRFVCVIALAQCGQLLALSRGHVDGQILTQPRGSRGFGYDPLFFYPPLGRSFAELSPAEKWSVSHRGNALRTLFHQLPALS